MSNATITFTPKRKLVAPDTADQLILLASLTTDDITSVVTSTNIPGGTAADGYILVQDDLGVWRRLHYSSWATDTFTIDTVDGEEDFANVNATAGNNVWITDLDTTGPYTLLITLNTFNQNRDDRVDEVTTLSGIQQASVFYTTDVYACGVIDIGAPNEPTVEEFEMFLASVVAKEDFTITNLDESDRVMNVQLTGGRGTRSRAALVHVNRFNYSFSVREKV